MPVLVGEHGGDLIVPRIAMMQALQRDKPNSAARGKRAKAYRIVLLQNLNMAGGYVYILANRPNGVLYVGVTNDLVRRVFEHCSGFVEGFTRRYGLKRLVYFERFDDISRRYSTGAQHQALVARLESPKDRRR